MLGRGRGRGRGVLRRFKKKVLGLDEEVDHAIPPYPVFVFFVAIVIWSGRRDGQVGWRDSFSTIVSYFILLLYLLFSLLLLTKLFKLFFFCLKEWITINGCNSCLFP